MLYFAKKVNDNFFFHVTLNPLFRLLSGQTNLHQKTEKAEELKRASPQQQQIHL